MAVFEGFHGTTRNSADEILKTGYFNFTNGEEEWLGKGIYFFDIDVKQACYFCAKARKYTEWAVLSCNIVTDNYIDLTMIDHYEAFKKTVAKLKNRYLKRSDGTPRKLMNSVYVNAMYDMTPFDLIRAVFIVPPGYEVDRTNIYPSELQICVRNRNCIKSVREVINHGYTKV